MTSDAFSSSDSSRSGRPLKHAQQITFSEPMALELGGQLPEVTVMFETYGKLNPQHDNAILICHALTGDSHVARHEEDDDSGWWDLMVGPGKSIDTDRYYVICPNILGGCRGTTGPNNTNPLTGRPYGMDFPAITVGDIVEMQRRLVDALGIHRLMAVIGGSLGGHMVLTWATRYPDRVGGAIALATSPRLTSQALAFDVVGRNAILRDPAYQNGQYYNSGEGHGPVVGLAIARMLGHITYLSREAMMQKFDSQRLQPREVQTQFETKFAVGSYLAYQGDKFGERFDANSYVTLTTAIDLFNLGETPEKLREELGKSKCRWLLISYSSDWLFPPFQSQEIVDCLVSLNKPVSYCNVQTDCGHDAFLLPNQLQIYGEMTRSFLDNLPGFTETTKSHHTADVAAADGGITQRTSIFHRHRLDYATIMQLIPPEASVLDLGCGNGGLLARLRDRGYKNLVGVERDEHTILECVRRGLDVIQTDLNKGLSGFSDGQFDFVVLSQTLQTITDVPRVLNDLLRVGRRGIVSFPNLAYHKLRTELAEQGKSPRVHGECGYRWYNTPYVRSVSIADFEEFCHDQGFVILQQIALDTEADREVTEDPNYNADVAVVVLSK